MPLFSQDPPVALDTGATASPAEVSRALAAHRRLLEEITDYVYFVRRVEGAGMKIIHSAGCEAITGFTAAELGAEVQTWLGLVLPEDRAEVERQWAQVAAGKNAHSLEYRIRRKDGEVRWVFSIVLPQVEGDGQVIGHDGLLRDVTARKLAEERGEQNQRLLAGLVDAAMDAIISIDSQQRVVLFNPAAERMFGISAAAVQGQPVDRFLPERYRAAHAAHIRRFAETGASSRRMGAFGRIFGLRTNGDEFPIEASISRVELGGNVLLTVILRDITQRVQAEADTAVLAALVTSSDDAIIGKSLSGHVTSWNAGAERIFGYTAREAIGRHISFLLPPTGAGSSAPVASAETPFTHYESQRLRKDGRIIDVSLTNSPILDVGGEIIGVSKIARDITERKRAEESLRESRERYLRFFANILETASICRVVRSATGEICDWIPVEMNAAALAKFGDARESLIGHRASEFLAPEEAAVRLVHLREVMASRQGSSFEARFRDIDFLTSLFPLDEETFVTTGIDITARNQAERDLRGLNQELEARVAGKTREVRLLAEAVANLSEGVLITDAQLVSPGPQILFVNRALMQITGYTAAELVGKSPRLLQGEGTERHVLDRLKRDLAAGRSVQCELTNYRKNGQPYEAELFITPLYDTAGQRTNFIAIHRDVSQRKELEQHVLEAAAAEQRRIGLELHDGIGQQLTGIALQAGTLRELVAGVLNGAAPPAADTAARETRLARVRDLATKLCARLTEAQKDVQALSRGIMPVQIDAEGLRSALEELANSTHAPPYLRCTFQCPRAVALVDNHVANQLYRIAQEATNNGLRHSRGDEIRIRLLQERDGLLLEVSDNGAGIELTAGPRSGMGLRIMEYRASLIGGTLQVERGAAGGTTVRCTVHSPARIIPVVGKSASGTDNTGEGPGARRA